jgi:type II secretory pathway predicted ATPase ExeA
MIALTTAWGFNREPFPQDVPVAELYPLPGLQPFLSRFQYAVEQQLSTVITGEVGSGKSTSLRAAAATLHPTQYRVLSIVATEVSPTVKTILQELSVDALQSSYAACSCTSV